MRHKKRPAPGRPRKFCDARPPENCHSFVRSLPPIDEASPGSDTTSTIAHRDANGQGMPRDGKGCQRFSRREQREKVGEKKMRQQLGTASWHETYRVPWFSPIQISQFQECSCSGRQASLRCHGCGICKLPLLWWCGAMSQLPDPFHSTTRA